MKIILVTIYCETHVDLQIEILKFVHEGYKLRGDVLMCNGYFTQILAKEENVK